MRDRYGRQINYMRISITDRCNLHCSYCRPGIPEHPDCSWLLEYEEILRVCRIAVKLGITRFKVTGGEPFARKGAVDFIKELAELDGAESVTVTTNGTLLDSEIIKEMSEAGLDGINISLDTMNPEKYAGITGEDLLDTVIRNIGLCCESGLCVKINTVLLSDITEDDVLSIAGLARESNISVRFIERMPMGSMAGNGPSGQYVKDILNKRGTKLVAEKERIGNGPAVYYSADGYRGYIGFIEPIHGKFCDSCNRLRMTSTGIVKPCLYYSGGYDIRQLLRNGAEDRIIMDRLAEAVYMKPEAHDFAKKPSPENMVCIGG